MMSNTVDNLLAISKLVSQVTDWEEDINCRNLILELEMSLIVTGSAGFSEPEEG